MSVKRSPKVGSVLSLIAGTLTLLLSRSGYLSWEFYSFPVSLILLSGVLLLIASTFMYIDSSHHMFWGAVVLFASGLGFLALGIAGVKDLIVWPGIVILILGMIGGAIGIAQNN
ncbi:MAG: hypothetical protein QW231_01035 [Candidatus Bathyarchaeia archaeon]